MRWSNVQFQVLIDASFYRGGTSRGLIFKNGSLVPFSQPDRESIICQAMGSPDPSGRQIDGLGGGTSSLSKVAIVSRVGFKLDQLAREAGHPFPGLEWLDSKEAVEGRDDIIYRFGQVAIRERSIDWGSTCGNMVAAVAHFSISHLIARTPFSLPNPRYVDPEDTTRFIWPVRIIAHNTGKEVIARVPVKAQIVHADIPELRKLVWKPSTVKDTTIAGVPGKALGIQIETPIEGSVLPTGNERNIIELNGNQIPVSIVDTGLPVVFVSAKSLDIPLSTLLEHPASIDANIDLMAKLEQVRQRACSLFPALRSILSPPSPKLCIVHPRCNYTTTGGEILSKGSMDLMIRTVSTGQLHHTVPATTLAALAASVSFRNSVVSEELSEAYPCATTREALTGQVGFRAITVGQPSGCSTATVKTTDGLPISILMMRTARPIMEGSVPVDPSINFNGELMDNRLLALKTKEQNFDQSRKFDSYQPRNPSRMFDDRSQSYRNRQYQQSYQQSDQRQGQRHNYFENRQYERSDRGRSQRHNPFENRQYQRSDRGQYQTRGRGMYKPYKSGSIGERNLRYRYQGRDDDST